MNDLITNDINILLIRIITLKTLSSKINFFVLPYKLVLFNLISFGIFQNFADLMEMKFLCLKPTLINWKREHDIHDINNIRFDKKKGSAYDV